MRQTATAKFYAQQWISLAIALVLFILLIIAWISIWRLSRNARLFYTLYWAICFPYTIISGPVVISGATMAFALAGYLTAGMILGILYFAKVNTSLIDQPSANN
jgi:ABC-type iron transport system FetAB permease component